MERIDIETNTLENPENNGYVNEYKVVKTKKRSWLNVLILNVGVCLAVSLGLLLAKLLGAGDVIDTFVKGLGA